jgi:hypothetical protein
MSAGEGFGICVKVIGVLMVYAYLSAMIRSRR